MSSPPIAAVMIHVADVEAARNWYQQAFPAAIPCRAEAEDFEFLSLGGIALEIVPADAKVGSGANGSVVYWRVPDFEDALLHFLSLGATLYRGPMRIENGESMCQVQDPWTNCIGLRGPSESPAVLKHSEALQSFAALNLLPQSLKPALRARDMIFQRLPACKFRIGVTENPAAQEETERGKNNFAFAILHQADSAAEAAQIRGEIERYFLRHFPGRLLKNAQEPGDEIFKGHCVYIACYAAECV